MTHTERLHATIHVAATTAAGVGAGMAQLPGSDAPVLITIQASMLMALAEELGVSLTRAAAAELVLTLGATMAGRGLSQVLVGWIPGFGNAVNAGTAFTLTESIGWAAVAYFKESP